MEISANSAISSVVQANAGAQNSQASVALTAEQLDTQKANGDAIAGLLATMQPADGTPGQQIDVRV